MPLHQDYLFGYYYDICNNIDLDSYSEELIKAMDFNKYGSVKFKEHLEKYKILINEENYKRLIDLFVFFNSR